MAKYDKSIYDQISDREKNLLLALYNHRCLTTEQIFKLFFDNKDKDVGMTYCKRRLNFLVKNKVIEKIKYEDTYIYYLEKIGVDCVVKKFNIPTHVYNLEKNNEERNYFRAYELKLKTKNVAHQLALNDFIVDFKMNYPHEDYLYYDEKHLTEYKDIRPDGLLKIHDQEFFIEIDMNSESSKQLLEKWVHYKRFFKSNDYYITDKKITILFVVSKADNLLARINLIKKSIFNEILDDIKKNIEIYVGTHEEMLNIIFERESYEKTLKETAFSFHKKGFKIFNAFDLKELSSYKFSYYMVHDNLNKEFLLDSFISEPLSVYNKICDFSKIEMLFKHKYQRNFSYVLLVKDELQAIHLLKILERTQYPNLYFTTLERLKKEKFHEMLFQVDLDGDCYNFKDSQLQVRYFYYQFT